jgi:hypothetical protein
VLRRNGPAALSSSPFLYLHTDPYCCALPGEMADARILGADRETLRFAAEQTNLRPSLRAAIDELN